MASPFTFTLDTREVDARLAELGRRAPRIAVASLNRAASKMRTFMKREIAKDIGMKQGDADKAMSIRKASAGDARAVLTVKGGRIPLIQLGARGREPSRGKGRGVSYRLGGQTRRIRTAFIATMPSGHRGVFKRSTAKPLRRGPKPNRSWLPIHQLFGPSLVSVFQKHLAKGRAIAQEELVKEVKRLLAREDLKEIESGIGGGQ